MDINYCRIANIVNGRHKIVYKFYKILLRYIFLFIGNNSGIK